MKNASKLVQAITNKVTIITNLAMKLICLRLMKVINRTTIPTKKVMISSFFHPNGSIS